MVATAGTLSQDGAPQQNSDATLSALKVVSDADYEEVVGADNMVVDFFADLCGPCRLAEPSLQRLDASTDVTVVKARLNENPRLRGWIQSHGLKVSFLPTLVLIRNGRPVRTIYGTKQILDASSLHAFATDDATEEEMLDAKAGDGGLLGVVRRVFTSLG